MQGRSGRGDAIRMRRVRGLPPERLSLPVVLGFFAVVYVYFAHPLADGDLWWHLNLGRWIVSHRALPAEDPLTYTVSPAFRERAAMFVRANWLAEAAYYLLYR